VTVAASVPPYPGGGGPGPPVYPAPPPAVFDAFAGRAMLVGPYTDATGTYLSGFAPVRARATDRVAAVLALDLDAAHWRRDVAEFRLAVIAVIFLIALLLIVTFVVRQRAWITAERIAASETRLAEAQELAQLGSWTYDRRNRRLLWSREMFRILDGDPQRVTPSLEEQQRRVAPADQGPLDAAVQAALHEGRGFEREVRVRRADGAERHVIVKAQPRRGAAGAVVRLTGTMQDITDRQRAEEALQQERDLLRTLIDQLPDYIYVKDTQGRFLAANLAVARLMQAPAPEALLGRTDADFYPPPLAEQYRRDEELIFRTGRPLINKEEPHQDASGQRRAVLTTKLPMRDPHGRIVGLVGISRDITARKAAEEEIRRLNAELEARVQARTLELTAANQELESFTYSVSHDLRAPLRHVIGFLSLLRQSLAGRLEPPAATYLADSAQEAARMATLIDDLLAFARAARADLHRDRVDLMQLLQSVRAQFEPDTRGRLVTWKIGALPAVVGDAVMLRQVLANLVDNALKFTRPRERAEVEIGSRPAPGEWVIFVRDNGVGFDPACADKLFGVFQRLHPRSQFEGTGVGLANVRRIIQRHGGRTWAESLTGCGATFYFSLPTGAGHRPPAAAQEAPP